MLSTTALNLNSRQSKPKNILVQHNCTVHSQTIRCLYLCYSRRYLQPNNACDSRLHHRCSLCALGYNTSTRFEPHRLVGASVFSTPASSALLLSASPLVQKAKNESDPNQGDIMRNCSTIPILEEPINFSLSVIPKEKPGIYALYTARPRNHLRNVAYVGHAKKLQQRIRHHLKERYTRIDADKISHVSWWLDCRFSNKNYRRVAEIVAFEVLNPLLCSRPAMPETQDLEDLEDFRTEMEGLFRGDPSGCFYPETNANLAHCVSQLCSRVHELESQQRH